MGHGILATAANLLPEGVDPGGGVGMDALMRLKYPNGVPGFGNNYDGKAVDPVGPIIDPPDRYLKPVDPVGPIIDPPDRYLFPPPVTIPGNFDGTGLQGGGGAPGYAPPQQNAFAGSAVNTGAAPNSLGNFLARLAQSGGTV